jgi:bifunctional polynucleotide phosphatase/kinase
MTEAALSKNQSVVIDNTNLDRESRQRSVHIFRIPYSFSRSSRYIEVAKQFHVPCRCFIMNVSVDHARHNNLFRQMLGTDAAHKDVTEIVILSAHKRYTKPTLDEGYSEIIQINMQPSFDDTDDEQLYYQYILDK